jgi:rod shape determining protein RodA
MISSAIIPQPLARLPWRLIWLVALICTIGVVTLFSAAGGSWSPWALKQALTILAFFGLAVAISYIPERFIKQLTFPSYVLILLLLIAVEMIGFVGKGAQRWIDLGFIRLQPSEFMKPGVVLVLARFYDLLPVSDIRRWRGLWPAAAGACPVGANPSSLTWHRVMVLVGGHHHVRGRPADGISCPPRQRPPSGPILFSTCDYQRNRVLIF